MIRALELGPTSPLKLYTQSWVFHFALHKGAGWVLPETRVSFNSIVRD